MKPSNIDKLPKDILGKLQQLLRDPRVTQLEVTSQINEILKNQGSTTIISKSSVNRYSKKMEKVGEKLRQSREISEMWIANLGSAPQGKLGKLINEMIRTMAFESAASLAEGKEPVPPKIIKDLALAVQRLEQATSVNERRERQIKDQTSKENQRKIERMAKSKGLSSLTVEQIREALSA